MGALITKIVQLFYPSPKCKCSDIELGYKYSDTEISDIHSEIKLMKEDIKRIDKQLEDNCIIIE